MSLKFWLTWAIGGFVIHAFKTQNQKRVTKWQYGITAYKHTPFIPFDENASKHNISQNWLIWSILTFELTSNPPISLENEDQDESTLSLYLACFLLTWMDVGYTHSQQFPLTKWKHWIPSNNIIHVWVTKVGSSPDKYIDTCNEVASVNMLPLYPRTNYHWSKLNHKAYNFVSSFIQQLQLKQISHCNRDNK